MSSVRHNEVEIPPQAALKILQKEFLDSLQAYLAISDDLKNPKLVMNNYCLESCNKLVEIWKKTFQEGLRKALHLIIASAPYYPEFVDERIIIIIYSKPEFAFEIARSILQLSNLHINNSANRKVIQMYPEQIACYLESYLFSNTDLAFQQAMFSQMVRCIEDVSIYPPNPHVVVSRYSTNYESIKISCQYSDVAHLEVIKKIEVDSTQGEILQLSFSQLKDILTHYSARLVNSECTSDSVLQIHDELTLLFGSELSAALLHLWAMKRDVDCSLALFSTPKQMALNLADVLRRNGLHPEDVNRLTYYSKSDSYETLQMLAKALIQLNKYAQHQLNSAAVKERICKVRTLLIHYPILDIRCSAPDDQKIYKQWDCSLHVDEMFMGYLTFLENKLKPNPTLTLPLMTAQQRALRLFKQQKVIIDVPDSHLTRQTRRIPQQL